jgi:hypothetical protein
MSPNCQSTATFKGLHSPKQVQKVSQYAARIYGKDETTVKLIEEDESNVDYPQPLRRFFLLFSVAVPYLVVSQPYFIEQLTA